MLKIILWPILSIGFLFPVIHAQQIASVYALPDIVVENIRVSSQSWNEPGKIMIRIDYTLFNDSARSTSCCPTAAGQAGWKQQPVANLLFHIRVESRSYPKGRFVKLTNGGTVGTSLKPKERAVFHATEVISADAARQYRVLADYGNWISEKNENNNSKTIIWPIQ